jgi:pilus assembly protein CpaB
MHSKIALLISLLIGLVAVGFMYVYIKGRISLVEDRYKPYAVLVASDKPIDQSTMIDESMLELKKIPEPYVEPDAINMPLREGIEDSELLSLKTRAVGFLAAINIKPGEQITQQKLLNIANYLSPSIPKGQRAMTISVNEISGVAGLVRPSDRVDIIGIFKTQDSKRKYTKSSKAVTILQNVQVLAVGRFYTLESIPAGGKSKSVDSGGVNFSNITVLLTPRQSMKLALAQDLGNLTLTLRPKFDYVPPRINDDLKNKPVQPYEATGIKEPLQISPQPKWLEQRGGSSLWAR